MRSSLAQNGGESYDEVRGEVVVAMCSDQIKETSNKGQSCQMCTFCCGWVFGIDFII